MEKKNIHVIPTTPNDETGGGIWIKETRDWCNLYITSGEEVKEKDWVLCSNGNIKKVTKSNSDDRFIENWQKIILTTDQGLIKDGIQAIDDEFLEWFVNHPEFENVDVERDSREIGNHLGSVSIQYGDYEITIPTDKIVPEIIEKYKAENKVLIQTIKDMADIYHDSKQERMYSEEDMIQFAEWLHRNSLYQSIYPFEKSIIKTWKESKS
jgi:hypothetical protein